MPADHQYPGGPPRVSRVVGRELPRATTVDAARTLVDGATAGSLSTIALDPAGYPFGSVVSDAVDPTGAPLSVISPLAEGVRPTIEADAATGTQMGGITLVPTDVVVTGPVATITYDLHVAGQPAYRDQTGAVALVEGAWIVQRDQFCAFRALARDACPA